MDTLVHKAKSIQDYLRPHKVVELPHPSYAWHFAPCEFFSSIYKLKGTLSGQRLQSCPAFGYAVQPNPNYSLSHIVQIMDFFLIFSMITARKNLKLSQNFKLILS